jgi:uncharacterized protein
VGGATKPSKYTVFVANGNCVYAVNFLSRAAVELSREAYRICRCLAAGRALPHGSDGSELADFVSMLKANLFLLDDDFDELEYIRERSRRERFNDRQLGLVIGPTMNCNFNCPYCFERHTEGVISTRVQDQLVSLVAARLHLYDSLAVQWFGGEPLLALAELRNLSKRMIALCATTDTEYAATVITNGLLLTPIVSRELVDLGVRDVQITLDGDRPLHDTTRREAGAGGSFDCILANIVAAPSELAIDVRIHLGPYNRDSVLRLVDRLGQAGLARRIRKLYFAPLFNYRVEMRSGAYRPDGRCFATAKKFGEMEIDALVRAREWGFRQKDILDVSYGICTAVRQNTMVVDPNGNLTKCYKDIGVKAEAVGTVECGLLTSASLDRWLREEIPRDEECRECRFLPVCLGGCARQWHEGADKSVICTPLRHNYKARIRLLLGQI